MLCEIQEKKKKTIKIYTWSKIVGKYTRGGSHVYSQIFILHLCAAIDLTQCHWVFYNLIQFRQCNLDFWLILNFA